MKLNKVMMFAVIAFGATSMAQAADNGSGTVTFTGSIIDAPCSIAPSSLDQTVELGAISSTLLRSNGNTGQSTPRNFQIKLEQCDNTTLKSVRTTFNGAAVPTNNSLLAITGTARGAGVAISSGGQPITLGTATAAQTIGANDNTLNFAAYLQGINASTAVVPGNFTAVANFTLAYQ
ncbi:fimbrial protein [Serratia sp. T13T92]|uniref:fimbrial protein n=1 Tax=Serratia sp. T13T92 TaxID=3397496 RepID=UPI0039E0EF4E